MSKPFKTIFITLLLFYSTNTFATQIRLDELGGKGRRYSDESVILQSALNSYDTVMIPSNYYCVISKTIRINSGNYLIGQDSITSVILLDADNFTWDNVFNPAGFVNAKTQNSRVAGSFSGADKNICFHNLSFKLEGNSNDNMQSILRFSSIIGLKIERCSFQVGSKLGKGHNAIIDLHSAYRNVIINNCNFVVSTNNGKHGGGIWIQNTSNTVCKDVEVKNCSFNANCKDEMLAIYTTGAGALQNIDVYNNSFSDTRDKLTNISFLTIFNNVENVAIRDNKFTVKSNNKRIDGIIRVGLSSDTGKDKHPNSITISKNRFSGKLSNAYTIRGYSGTSVTLKENAISNLGKGLKNKLFVKLPAYIKGAGWIMSDN